MSADFDLHCKRCRVSRHLGQIGIGHASFGYGNNDAVGRRTLMEFVALHTNVEHDLEDLFISAAQDNRVPDNYVREIDDE